MMTSAEKSALLSLQSDIFNARADAAHERECVVNALQFIGEPEVIRIMTSDRPDNEKVAHLGGLLARARKELNRERKKDT